MAAKRKKKFPTLLLIITIVVAVTGVLGFNALRASYLTPAPVDINLIGNGMTPEVTDGPATIVGTIIKSDEVGEEGTYALISKSSGALYELDLKNIDNLVGSTHIVQGTVFSPANEGEAPMLYVAEITPYQN
jgi:hypothetical protein